MQKKIKRIPLAVMKAFIAWEWPGNIRELEKLMERAVILTRGRSLEAPLSELRKVKLDDGERTEEDQGNIARIVKETVKALHANSTVSDQDTKKQREAIVRSLTVSKGRVGGTNGAAVRMGRQPHYSARPNEKTRHRSSGFCLTRSVISVKAPLTVSTPAGRYLFSTENTSTYCSRRLAYALPF